MQRSHFKSLSWTHLINEEIIYLEELVSIFCHFWDFDVQLQILHWKVTKVLDLRNGKKRIISEQFLFPPL